MIERTHSRCWARWLRLFLALALAAALSGCLDKVIEQIEGDAEPSTNAAEAGYVTAQFDQDARRVTLPNDVVLQSVVTAGLFTGDGTARNMPIRIPFSGPIAYPFDGKHSPTPAELTLWGGSVFLLDTGTLAVEPALTTSAGGNFKAIYLDSNNDLVLVPGDAQLSNGTTYAVVVTRGVTDLYGNPVNESVPIFYTKLGTSLTDAGGHSTVELLTDEQAQALEQLRVGYAPLYAGLEGSGIDRENVALLATFTVESTDSTALSAGLIAALEADVGANVPADADIQWLDAAGTGLVADTTTAGDFKALFEGMGIPMTGVSAVRHGVIPCRTYLEPDLVVTGNWLPIADTTADSGCPNANGLPGYLEFWLSVPTAGPAGLVVFQHGITRNATDFAAIASSLAQAGMGVIAIDLWAHGSRTYSVGGTPVEFIVPDDPELSASFITQSRMDIARVALMAAATNEVTTEIGGVVPVHFVGTSLGAMVGALTASSATTYFDDTVLNVVGGDLVDIVLEGEIGDTVKQGVADALGLTNPSVELNQALLGVEMLNRHALFASLTDPLAVYDPASTTPAPLLVQQMVGDSVVPNNDTELFSRVIGLAATYEDGDGSVAAGSTPTPYQARWIFDPANYTPATAGHGFLLDGETTATAAGQSQVVKFLLSAGIEDPLNPIAIP